MSLARTAALTLALTCLLTRAPAATAADAATFHVAPGGRDAWSGTRDTPDPAGHDGPFATLGRARDAARALRAGGRNPGGPVRVVVHPGRYELPETLVFTSDDSGTEKSPTIFTGATQAVVSGGRVVTGWRPAPGPRGEWVADLPGLKEGWRFRHVAVNGERRARPRLPETGWFTMAGLAGADPKARYDTPADRFEYAPGQVDPNWTNLRDVEPVVLHFWVDAHFLIKSVDPARRVVTLDRHSLRKFTDDYTNGPARYFVENVYEALRPGDFYANTADGTFHYLPRPGETPGGTQIVAPRLTTLVAFRGDPAAGRSVSHVRFEGITFADTTYEPGPRDAVDGQAASEVPGAVTATGARDVVFQGCRLVNLGGYGLDVGDGCRGLTFAAGEIVDAGAGGVKINGGAAGSPESRRTVGTVLTDNRFHRLGREYHSGVGVLLRNAAGCTITHNEIAELDYTAVSVGWVWGYGPSVSRENVIEWNHLHHIGRGLLSDMGGVYTLGVSPGTVVRHNLVHDVQAHGYGGWGLYTDEGSTGIVLEDNVVYRTTHGGFHQHYGRDNVVRNNIFALARDEQLARSRSEPHRSFTFERNVVYYTTGQLFGHDWSGGPDRITVDRNVYWDATGATPKFPGGSFEAWQDRGFDRHSVVADPRFVAPDRDDFALKPDSPALALGFRPIDLKGVGPRTPAPGSGGR